MSVQPDQDADGSALSWESVLRAAGIGSTPSAPITSAAGPAAGIAPPSVVPAAAPDVSPAAADSITGAAPALDFELSIPPLSLDPLSLDPLPPIADGASSRATPVADHDVLGDLHLEIPPLELTDAPSPTPPVRAATPIAIPEPSVVDLHLAPFDVPDIVPSGRIPTVTPEPERPNVSPAAAGNPSASVDVTPAPTVLPMDVPGTAAPTPSLPTDPVPDDHAPTTVIAAVTAPPVQTVAAVPAVPVPSLQPSRAHLPQAAPARPVAYAEPAPLSRRDRKHQQKLQKHQQKQAIKQVKAASRSGSGGVALFFTLLVLVGLIAGAIVFGRPYLFPDEWDASSKPYGEAIETVRGADIADPIVVQRRAADVFATSMTAHVVGPWELEQPMWRSLGLISGMVDAPLLGELVENWDAAYYEPSTAEVIADDAAGPPRLDAAIAEAMAAGALDQEMGWAASIDDSLLDSPALTRAMVTASSRRAAAATTFGAADTSIRNIGVATFLPPVLEYRVNAPLAFAEFSTDDPTQVSADFEALRVAALLQTSGEPELVIGDTMLSSQQVTDRTFWYLVFASYVDAPTAYAASNALVQASLAAADSAGSRCTYATFSGSDIAGTTLLSDVLAQWATSAPAEMNASLSTLSNGTMQLRSCDPGVGFASGARFGIGREIARFRSVELAAVASIPAAEEASADRSAAIAQVRAAGIALPMTDLAFDATFAESAERARELVAANREEDDLVPGTMSS